jgi:hypothetical protein
VPPVLRSLIALIVLALPLAACGPSYDATDKTGTAKTPTTTPTAKTPTAGTVALASEWITGSFDNGTGGWTELDKGTSFSSSKAESEQGKASLEVKTKGESEFEGVRTDSLPVDPDRTYTAHASVRAPKGTMMQISIQERDTGETELGSTVTKFKGTGEWDRVKVQRVFSPKGENARVVIRTGNKPQQLIFYVDGVGVQERAAK